MIESQIRYVADAMAMVDRGRATALDVRPEVQNDFNARIQRKLANGVWSQGGCDSWYLDAMSVNRTVWPGYTWRYWMETRKVDPADFQLT